MILRMLITAVLSAFIGINVFAGDIEVLDSPAGIQTSLSRVTLGPRGKLYLSWVKSEGELSSLLYSRLDGDKWSAAKLISSGKDWFVNWADFPFLAVNDEGLTAHWLKKSSDGTYDYDIAAAFYSTARGDWSNPVIIHKDGVSAEHGFVSMLPMSNGRTFISWLDGRNTRSDKPSGLDGHGHAMGGMTLRAGIFNNDGKTLEDWELDSLVCDCCQTSSAMTDSGPIVVYRDRTTDEIRDTYITRLGDGGWSAPMAVHDDGWKVAGCPVNGPSVATREGLTAVAWFTAKDDFPRVLMALSQDDGKTFGKPVLVAKENTSGRVSIASLDSGDIAVSWLETEGAAAKIILVRYDRLGKLKERLTIADTTSSRRSGFPVIAALDNDVYVTWTDVLEAPHVRVTRVRF